MLKKRSISSAMLNKKDFWMTFPKISIAYNVLQCSVLTFTMLLSKDTDPER